MSRTQRAIDSYLDSLTRRGAFSGTVLVARSDSTVFEKSYGDASVELGIKNEDRNRYRIHSITKQFLAMGAAILAQRGRLSLSAPIGTYLDRVPPAWRAVTVEQLLTHTSGLPFDENRWFDAFEGNDVKTQVENWMLVAPAAQKDSLRSVPGTSWAYNNFNYELLGAILERAAGKELGLFLQDAVFGPALMRDAGFDRRAQVDSGVFVGSALVPRLASGYNGSPDSLVPASPKMYAAAGAGGMYATAADLLAYDRALNAGTLLPPAAAEAMITRAYRLRPGVAYGYGWMINDAPDSTLLVHHSGGYNGYTSDYARYPTKHLCVIVLSNRGYVDSEKIRRRIAQLVIDSDSEDRR